MSEYLSGNPKDWAESQRRAKRHPVVIGCEIRQGTNRWQQSRITDLSVCGFKVITGAPLRVGRDLFIRFAGLEILGARVQWARDLTTGCEFASPISEYVLEHIVRTAHAD